MTWGGEPIEIAGEVIGESNLAWRFRDGIKT